MRKAEHKEAVQEEMKTMMGSEEHKAMMDKMMKMMMMKMMKEKDE